MSKAEYDALVQQQPLEAIAVYWNEMIQRIHLGSCSALLRHEQWLNGMAIAAEHECYFGFFASFRGFLESAADSAYSLGTVAYFIADNLSQIVAHLQKRTTSFVLGSYELEERLIHFSHGRRLVKGESADPAHMAKQMKEYMKSLANAGAKAHELYSLLCSITHPSAESVIVWYAAEDDQGLTWRRVGVPNLDTITALVKDWKATNEIVFQLAFIPLLFNLRILHKIDFLPKIPELRKFPFSRFPAWRRIEKATRM